MNAVLNGGAPLSDADEQLTKWLTHGEATLRAFDDGRHPVDGRPPQKATVASAPSQRRAQRD